MKRILIVMDDAQYGFVRSVKDRLGLTWEELFFQSIKAVNDALEGSGEDGED